MYQNQSHSLITIILIAITFREYTFFKLLISLEYKYESALLKEANRSYTSLHHAKSVTKLTEGNPSWSASFLQREGIHIVSNKYWCLCAAFLSRRASSKHWCPCSLPQVEELPKSIGVCAAFLSRRASKNLQ